MWKIQMMHRFVSLRDLKHWELAPTNPGAIEKANIPFAITSADLRDPKQFWANLRKAMEYGLTEAKAFDALTKTPATWLGVYDKIGSIDEGKLANFLITNGNLFNDNTNIIENWVQGEKYAMKEDVWNDVKGQYNLVINAPYGTRNFTLDVKSTNSASILSASDTLSGKFSYDGNLIKLEFFINSRKKTRSRWISRWRKKCFWYAVERSKQWQYMAR